MVGFMSGETPVPVTQLTAVTLRVCHVLSFSSPILEKYEYLSMQACFYSFKACFLSAQSNPMLNFLCALTVLTVNRHVRDQHVHSRVPLPMYQFATSTPRCYSAATVLAEFAGKPAYDVRDVPVRR